MNKEERKAIEDMNRFANGIDMSCVTARQMQIILNLIEKQQKEIENLKEINKEHQKLNGELREEIERQGNTREIEEKYVEEKFVSKDKIRKYIKENKRIYEMKTPNRNRVIYKDCVLLTKEVKELLEE